MTIDHHFKYNHHFSSDQVRTFWKYFQCNIMSAWGRAAYLATIKCLQRISTYCMLHLFSWEYSCSCLPKLGLTYVKRVHRAM